MNLLQRLLVGGQDERGVTLPWFTMDGHVYPLTLNQTLTGTKEETSREFPGYVDQTYRGNGIVFACLRARMALFRQARFAFREIRQGQPGDLFGAKELRPLEQPWPNGNTGDLLARMLQDVDLAGNAYVARRGANLRRLRPDWVDILLTEDAGNLDTQVAGYLYHQGGRGTAEPVRLSRELVAHFMVTPDPTGEYRGMSWLTPLIREVFSDTAAVEHKWNYFVNGATPSMIIRPPANLIGDQYDSWVDKFRRKYQGTGNAHKPMIVGGGADMTVVGSNLKDIDYKLVQGAGETRIAAAAGVPPIIVGLSEGLDAATYSNYGQARRAFADLTMHDLWANVAGSLQPIITPPGPSTDWARAGAELWYDDRQIPFLREDEKDRAEIQQVNSSAIRQLVDAGFEPATVTDAITSGDLSRLKHTGLYSVQLQPPQPEGPPPAEAAPGNGKAPAMQVPG